MPKRYLDDNGNPVAPKAYLDDDGNPMNKVPASPAGTIEAEPPITSWRGIKSRANTLADKAGRKIVENMPAILGTVGGLVASETGPGAVAGAALGGAAGRAFQQVEGYQRGEVPRDKQGYPSSAAAAKDIAWSGVEQGAAELVGQGIAKMAKVIAPVARGDLLASGAKAGDLPALHGQDIWERIIPDFDETLKAAGSRAPRTIGEFEQVTNATMKRLEGEYSSALQPISNVKLSTQSVADAIRAKITPNMAKTAEGRLQARALLRRASEFDKQSWSVGDLDLERSKLAKTFKNMAPSSREAAQKLDAEAMADRAANEAMNDLLYPMADQSASKPSGYFKGLKQKESALYTLKDRVAKAKTALTKQSSEQAGNLTREKVHVRSFVHPNGTVGGVGGANQDLKGDTLKNAGIKVARGFPGPGRRALNATRGIASKGMSLSEVDALPVRLLMESIDPGPAGPKTKQLQESRDQLLSAQ